MGGTSGSCRGGGSRHRGVKRRCLAAMLMLSGSALGFAPSSVYRLGSQSQKLPAQYPFSHENSRPELRNFDIRAWAKRRERPERPNENVRPDQDTASVTKHLINWYPGHIAKAENELQDYIKMVDVIIEARDARIPASTTHPLVRQCEWSLREAKTAARTCPILFVLAPTSHALSHRGWEAAVDRGHDSSRYGIAGVDQGVAVVLHARGPTGDAGAAAQVPSALPRCQAGARRAQAQDAHLQGRRCRQPEVRDRRGGLAWWGGRPPYTLVPLQAS